MSNTDKSQSDSRSTGDVTASIVTCGCGCETEVNGKRSVFRPGHDARLVSLAVDATIQSRDYLGMLLNAGTNVEDDIQVRITAFGVQIARFFSEALSLKYDNAAHNAWAKEAASTKTVKANRKANTTKSLVGQPAWVKVGRWFYNGQVSSITVDNEGRENASSDVCVVTVGDKSHQVDSSAMAGRWGFGHVDRKTGQAV